MTKWRRKNKDQGKDKEVDRVCAVVSNGKKNFADRRTAWIISVLDFSLFKIKFN
jgi:hypothetical protein